MAPPRIDVTGSAMKRYSRDEVMDVLASTVYLEREYRVSRVDNSQTDVLMVGWSPDRRELVELMASQDLEAGRLVVFHAMPAAGKNLARMDDQSLIPAEQQQEMRSYLGKVQLDHLQPGSRAMRSALDQVELSLRKIHRARSSSHETSPAGPRPTQSRRGEDDATRRQGPRREGPRL